MEYNEPFAEDIRLDYTEQEKEVDEIIEDEEYEFEGELPYCLLPSVTKTISVGGKVYTVKSYFKGGKDFRKTVKQLAVKQAFTNVR